MLQTYIPSLFLSSPDEFDAINAAPSCDGCTGYFGQLASTGEPLSISFAPVYRRGDKLYFHLAAANSHCDTITRSPLVFVAMGAHGYISPRWLETSAVPTWNYSALMLTGSCREITDAESQMTTLAQLSEIFEQHYRPSDSASSSWNLSRLTTEAQEAMRRQLRFFEMTIDTAQAKAKLSQNRTAVDIENIVAQLDDTQTPLASAMREANREKLDKCGVLAEQALKKNDVVG